MHISWVWKGALCIMYQKGTTFISRMYIKYTNLTAITTTDVYTKKNMKRINIRLNRRGSLVQITTFYGHTIKENT